MKWNFAVACGLLFSACFAGTSQAASLGNPQSSRMEHRFGVHATLLGDPMPAMFGVGLNFNLFDWTRLSAGYGVTPPATDSAGASTLSSTSMGGRVTVFVPKWDLSPTLGIGYSYAAITSDAGTGHGGVFSAGIGLDMQTAGGFNLAVGFNILLQSVTTGSPFINIGWFL